MNRRDRADLSDLTSRQLDVMRKRSAGLLLKEIAAGLGISVSAVNASQREAWHKLGTDNHVDAERKLTRLLKKANFKVVLADVPRFAST